MIVTVTPRQWDIISEVLGDGPLRAAMTRDRIPVGQGNNTDITAPFIGWQIVKQRLIDTHLSPTLGRQAHTPDSAMRTLKRISAAQNTMMRHPAMKGIAMLGVQAGWFPVWVEDGIEGFSPVPTPNGRFVVIGPIWRQADRAAPITTWGERGVVPHWHWLASEDAHSSLLCEQG